MKSRARRDPIAGLPSLPSSLIILAGLTATISWQWSNITGPLPLLLASAVAADPDSAGADGRAEIPRPRAAGPSAGQAPVRRHRAEHSQAGPAVAQRVVLYEEDPNDPQGKRFVGSAVWRTETVRPAPGSRPNSRFAPTSRFPDGT